MSIEILRISLTASNKSGNNIEKEDFLDLLQEISSVNTSNIGFNMGNWRASFLDFGVIDFRNGNYDDNWEKMTEILNNIKIWLEKQEVENFASISQKMDLCFLIECTISQGQFDFILNPGLMNSLSHLNIFFQIITNE